MVHVAVASAARDGGIRRDGSVTKNRRRPLPQGAEPGLVIFWVRICGEDRVTTHWAAVGFQEPFRDAVQAVDVAAGEFDGGFWVQRGLEKVGADVAISVVCEFTRRQG